MTHSNKQLAKRAHNSLIYFLKLGCKYRLLPYEWNNDEMTVVPARRRNMFLFSIQKYQEYVYTSFMWFRLVQRFMSGEFSLLAALWALATFNTSLAYFTMATYPKEVMHFTNRLLTWGLLGQPEIVGQNNWCHAGGCSLDPKIAAIETDTLTSLSHHLSFNTFLLYANPIFHLYIISQSPCAPNLLSSLYFQCSNSLQNTVSLADKSLFLVFEYYNVIKWQYVVSFMWICIYMGIGAVGMELKKLADVRVTRLACSGRSRQLYLKLKECELIIQYLNNSFRYYLGLFVMTLAIVVSLLLYGLVRFWRLGPKSASMFPMCALRCGYEFLTILSVAAAMSKDCERVLENWRKGLGQRKCLAGLACKERALHRQMERSCRKQRCSSGMFFTHSKTILLITVDACINIAVNFLVSF